MNLTSHIYIISKIFSPEKLFPGKEKMKLGGNIRENKKPNRNTINVIS